MMLGAVLGIGVGGYIALGAIALLNWLDAPAASRPEDDPK